MTTGCSSSRLVMSVLSILSLDITSGAWCDVGLVESIEIELRES